MEADIAYIGDEDVNQEAAALIDRLLRDDEIPVAVAGFDYETKVIAVTDQRGHHSQRERRPGPEPQTRRHTPHEKGRKDAGDQYPAGRRTPSPVREDDTVQELVETAHRQKSPQRPQPAGPLRPQGTKRHKRSGRTTKAPLHRGEGQVLGGTGPDQPRTDTQSDRSLYTVLDIGLGS